MKRQLKLALLLVGATSLPMAAQGESPRYEIGGGLSYFVFDDDMLGLQPEDELGYRLYGGARFGDHWGLELVYDQVSTETDFAGMDLDLSQYYLSGLYHFMVEGAAQPYLSLGWGQNEFELEAGEGETTATNLGLGIKWMMANHWILRPSMNYFVNTELDDNHMTFGLTLAYTWGEAKPMTAKVAAPADADGDGVADSADRCPRTAPGTAVDAMGCELDSDNDGVFDSIDACPATAARIKVDARGCPLKLSETVSIDLQVNFDSNSDRVKPEFYNEIRKVADFLAQYAGTKVVIEGHTDSSGAAAYNKDLSQRRADAVANALVEQFGIARSRVSAVGYGEEQPIASEATAAGRLANRRVVAKVSATVESVQQR